MSRDYPIPGGTLTLAEDHEITERKLRPVKVLGLTLSENERQAFQRGLKKIDRSSLSPQAMAKVIAMQDAYIWQYLLSWTLEQPIPADPDAMQDLSGALYDAVMSAGMEHMDALKGGDAKFTVDAVEDEASPTGPSGD